jgi:hypothetical protein
MDRKTKAELDELMNNLAGLTLVLSFIATFTTVLFTSDFLIGLVSGVVCFLILSALSISLLHTLERKLVEEDAINRNKITSDPLLSLQEKISRSDPDTYDSQSLEVFSQTKQQISQLAELKQKYIDVSLGNLDSSELSAERIAALLKGLQDVIIFNATRAFDLTIEYLSSDYSELTERLETAIEDKNSTEIELTKALMKVCQDKLASAKSALAQNDEIILVMAKSLPEIAQLDTKQGVPLVDAKDLLAGLQRFANLVPSLSTPRVAATAP